MCTSPQIKNVIEGLQSKTAEQQLRTKPNKDLVFEFLISRCSVSPFVQSGSITYGLFHSRAQCYSDWPMLSAEREHTKVLY